MIHRNLRLGLKEAVALMTADGRYFNKSSMKEITKPPNSYVLPYRGDFHSLPIVWMVFSKEAT